MSSLIRRVLTVEYDGNYYPVAHWKHLSRFAVEGECDPRGLFRLADDKWEAWPYALNGMPSRARHFRFHFGHLHTFLKPYVKWYCYHQILGNAGSLRGALANIPTLLVRADRYISELGFRTIDDISPASVFQNLWDAQIRGDFTDVPLPSRATAIQSQTRTFWLRMKIEFGAPFLVPPVASHINPKPTEFAADRSKIIPEHVIKQLTNKLGLHRDEIEFLKRFDHLRLCVLMLTVCLGRRVNEILLSPRGVSGDGPLSRRPSKAGAPEGSLWFQYLPNKDGPADNVFISPNWEDLALYCVRELVKYSDEIRHLAVPEERGLLILVSGLNWTGGKRKPPAAPISGVNPPEVDDSKGRAVYRAYPLDAGNFEAWVNGCEGRKGVLKLWGITADGSADGPPYHLPLSYTRHTRHSAVALDPQTSLLARQRDLNHRDRDAQFAYQHRLRENNDSLLAKIKEGKLFGRGVEWLSVVLDVGIPASSPAPSFQPGRPSPMTPRMLSLVRNNPLFIQQNRVPCGICVSPNGPSGCAEFLNCTSAGEGGCHSFVVDVSDARMLHELNNKADGERRLHQDSTSAGRVVQAQKRATQARRTEDLRDEALRRASKETLAALRRIQSEIEEEGL